MGLVRNLTERGQDTTVGASLVSRKYRAWRMDDVRQRLVMIDDQQSYAEALGLALSMTTDLELAARAPDGPTGIDLVLAIAPDAILCDYRLPAGDTGTAVLTELRARGCEAPAIVLTGFLAPQVQRETNEIANAMAMSKDSPISDIVGAVRSLLAGEFSAEANAPQTGVLSVGELEVLELLNSGLAPAEIAEQLFLSLHTVRARIKSIHRKLDVTSQVEALAAATRLGLLVPPS